MLTMACIAYAAVAPPRAANVRMVSSWYDSGKRLDGSAAVAQPDSFYSFLNAELSSAPANTPTQPPTPSPAVGLPALKASFRLESARCDRGLSAGGESIERLQGLADELEAAGRTQWTGGSAPTSSPLLLGRWYLDFCDAADVRSLSLVALPLGGRIGSIYQDVAAAEEPGKFTVQNGVNFVPPSTFGDLSGLAFLYEIEARCAVLDDTRVSLAFVGARTRFSALPALGVALPGSVADPIIEAVRGIIGERVFLETTYLDDDMRIARGPQKELYVLSRRK